MSKKYKLIKEYPNSPKLGSVIIDTNPNNGAKDCWFSEDWGKSGSKAFFIPRSTNPEKHPEFWELVKEKEWEVLDKNKKTYFTYVEETLLSIKRLSDNEVFSIGDKCNLSNGSGNRNPILRFEVRNESFGLEKYRNKDRIVVFLETMHKTEWGPIELDSLVKSKEPLFVTEDGVEIFKGDSYWFLDDDKPTEVARAHDQSGKNNLKCFSTQKAAKEYFDLNRPKYSLQDIRNAIIDYKGCYREVIDMNKLKK